MNKDLIKKLANRTISSGKIDQEVAKFALSSLTRKELIAYLAALKKAVYKTSVRIISQDDLSIDIKKHLESKFKDRQVFFEQDKSISAGIKIVVDDATTDFTLEGYIETALEQLRS